MSIIEKIKSFYNPFSSEAIVAKASSPVVEERLYPTQDAARAVVHNDQEGRARLTKANENAAKGASIGAMLVAAPQVAPHVLKVMANPMAAKTGVGAATAATADVVGTVYGVKRNSELLDKWTSGNFNYSDPAEFGLNLIPGYFLTKGVKAGVDMIERIDTFRKLKEAARNMPEYTSGKFTTTNISPDSKLVYTTEKALSRYNPRILDNTELINQLRVAEQDIISGKTPVLKGYYREPLLGNSRLPIPAIFELYMRTPLFKEKFPNGFTMFARGIPMGQTEISRFMAGNAVYGGNIPVASAYAEGLPKIIKRLPSGQEIYDYNPSQWSKFTRENLPYESTLGVFIVPKQNPKIIDVKGAHFMHLPGKYPQTDDLAWAIGRGDERSHVIQRISDGGVGNPFIKGQSSTEIIYPIKDGYPKSVYNSDLVFDFTNPDPFYKSGGQINPYK